MTVLRRLFQVPVEGAPAADVEEWWQQHDAALRTLKDPFAAACITASNQDRLAWAVASAYAGALEALVGTGHPLRRSLLVTEPGGNGPRAIDTRYDAETGRLDGTKSFATLGNVAERFLVLADTNAEQFASKNLVVLEVPADAPGIRVETGPSTPFCPELSHARVIFEDVSVPPDAIVETRGWYDFVKPFRMIEDIYVLGCVTGWLLRVARASRQVPLTHRLSGLVVGVERIAAESPKDPETAVAYAGLHDLLEDCLERFDWSSVDEEIATLWERDRTILNVASAARERRIERADREFDFARAEEVRRWTWTSDDGRFEGYVVWTDDGWLEWAEWETTPRGSGGGHEQLITEFLRKGPPSWAPEDIGDSVREAVSDH